MASLWRYGELLPLQSETNLVFWAKVIPLLLDAKNLAIELGLRVPQAVAYFFNTASGLKYLDVLQKPVT